MTMWFNFNVPATHAIPNLQRMFLYLKKIIGSIRSDVIGTPDRPADGTIDLADLVLRVLIDNVFTYHDPTIPRAPADHILTIGAAELNTMGPDTSAEFIYAIFFYVIRVRHSRGFVIGRLYVLDARIAARAAAAAAATAAAAAAETARIEALITARTDPLDALLATANTDLATAQAALATANTNLATAQTALATANTELDAANAECDRLDGELDKANDAIEELEDELNTANTDLGTVRAELATANGNLATARADVAARDVLITTLTAQNAALTAQNAALTAQNAALTAQIAGQ